MIPITKIGDGQGIRFRCGRKSCSTFNRGKFHLTSCSFEYSQRYNNCGVATVKRILRKLISWNRNTPKCNTTPRPQIRTSAEQFVLRKIMSKAKKEDKTWKYNYFKSNYAIILTTVYSIIQQSCLRLRALAFLLKKITKRGVSTSILASLMFSTSKRTRKVALQCSSSYIKFSSTLTQNNCSLNSFFIFLNNRMQLEFTQN